MSMLSKLKSYAPGIAVVVILVVFVILEYGILPARRAAQTAALTAAQTAAPPAAQADTPAAAPPPASAPPAVVAPAPETPAAEPPAAAPAAPAPSGPQDVPVAATWSTYHGGTDLSGYTSLNLRERPVVVWQVLLDGVIRQSAVANEQGMYLCTTTGKVVALDFSGKERWSRQLTRPGEETPERVEAPVACFLDTVLVSTLTGRVHALDAATGEPRWTYEVGGEVLGTVQMSTPADPAQSPRLYVIQREDGTLHSFDLATGQGLGKGAPISRCDGSPAIAGDLLVYGSCDFAIHVYDAHQGGLLKNIRLCEDCQVASGPALVGEFAYTGSRAGYFYSVNVRTGGVAWTNQDCSSEVFTTPAVAAETVVFGAEDGGVYALDRATGRTKWKHESGGTPTSAVIADGTVLVSVDGRLQALELESGAPTWNHEVSDHIASPAIIDGKVIIGSEDGTVLALGPKAG